MFCEINLGIRFTGIKNHNGITQQISSTINYSHEKRERSKNSTNVKHISHFRSFVCVIGCCVYGKPPSTKKLKIIDKVSLQTYYILQFFLLTKIPEIIDARRFLRFSISSHSILGILQFSKHPDMPLSNLLQFSVKMINRQK